MNYPDSLSVSDVEYAKFDFKGDTNEKEWHLAITTGDDKIRNTWHELLVERQKQQSPQ
ncbi:hypothetical protein IWQ61_001663, partial [Dispira simplex]